MFFWGKILGTLLGFLLSNGNLVIHIFSTLLGLFFGHLCDIAIQNRFSNNLEDLILQEKEEFIFDSLFSVMGNNAKTKVQLTKADFQISNVYLDIAYNQEENVAASEFHLLNTLQTAKHRMEMQQSFVGGKDNALLNSLQATKHQALANQAFSAGKENNFSMQETLIKLTQIIGDNRNMLQVFLAIQIQLAYTYCDPQNKDEDFLLTIGEHLGFSALEVNRLVRIIGEQQQFYQPKQQVIEPNHYHTLDINEGASSKEIKQAYRRQMSLYHPDKLASKNLSEEEMQQATEKTKNIQEAYTALRDL